MRQWKRENSRPTRQEVSKPSPIIKWDSFIIKKIIKTGNSKMMVRNTEDSWSFRRLE